MNKKSEWNAAAYIAALKGDLANAAIASTPGGIEAQEARGQRDFVASETLPKEILYADGVDYEALGIKVLGDQDDLFYNVQLPTGWTKKPTSHSMWSELLDDKGRKRAAIFYKAAFYDRKAHISFCTRYTVETAPACGWDEPYEVRQAAGDIGYVMDGTTILWQTAVIPNTRETYGEARKRAMTRLTEMYPDWQDVRAYWNDDAAPATTDAANDAHSDHENGNEE